MSFSFWCVCFFCFCFLFRKHMDISHPNKLQVVPNYAFPWNVSAEKNQSIPKFLSEDVTLVRKDFTVILDMLQGEDTWISDYKHKFSRQVTSMTKLTKMHAYMLFFKVSLTGKFLPKSEATASIQRAFPVKRWKLRNHKMQIKEGILLPYIEINMRCIQNR